MAILEKNGITIEIDHPTEIQRYKAQGFSEPLKAALKAPTASPADQNVKAIAEVNEAAAGSEVVELETMTLDELRAEAQRLGLKRYSSLNKGDLIALIEAGQEVSDD